jgi:hypothetical protein
MTHLTLNGKVVSEIGYRVSHTGRPMAFFDVFTDTIFRCKCFSEVAEYAREHLQRDAVICASGKVTTYKGEEGFIINTLVYDDKKLQGKTKVVGVSADRLKEFEQQQAAHGYVKIKQEITRFPIWRANADCVEVAGGYIPKIEYVMDVFGPEKITKLLRHHVGDVMMNKEMAARYREWLDKMVSAANLREARPQGERANALRNQS